MCVLNLSLSSRNGEVVSRVVQGGKITGATILFPEDVTRNLAESKITVEDRHIWQLIPFGSKEVAKFLRVTPIGMIDAELLFGTYRILGREKDKNFVQSAFTGRWDGDDTIFHLHHCLFETQHRVRAFRLRSLPGIFTNDLKFVRLAYSDSFEAVRDKQVSRSVL
jgi:hypothetical protein